MSCANCGVATPPQAAQCPACGMPLAVNPPQPAAWDSPPGGSTGAGSWDAPPAGDPWAPLPGGAGGPSWGASTGGPGPTAGSPPAWGAPPRQPYEPYPSGWDEPRPGSADRLAGWWQRVGATFLDGLLVFIPARLVDAGIGTGSYYFFLFVVTAVYTTVLIATRGQTVGMMAVGTKCIREGTGALLPYGPALGRWAMAELLNVTVIGGVLDVLWPLWDAKNQTLHDKVVHSLVVRVR